MNPTVTKMPKLGALLHNARNRLTQVAHHLMVRKGNDDMVQELHIVACQLVSAMELLRMEEDPGRIECHQVDLETFFGDLVGEARLLAPPDLSLTYEADFSENLCPVWIFDAGLIRMVLVDALANAWRYARSDVRLSARCAQHRLEFCIADDGPGFSATVMKSEKLGLPHQGGSGQGLNLARQIATRHSLNGRHGKLILENDGGAVFKLVLP